MYQVCEDHGRPGAAGDSYDRDLRDPVFWQTACSEGAGVYERRERAQVLRLQDLRLRADHGMGTALA